MWKFILISLQLKYAIFNYLISNFDQIWWLMGVVAVHCNRVSNQHWRLHISEIACTVFLFLFQFWTLFKFDMMQSKVK